MASFKKGSFVNSEKNEITNHSMNKSSFYSPTLILQCRLMI